MKARRDSVDPGGAEGHPGRRLATLLGSAALIALLVIIGVVVAINHGDGNTDPATPTTAATAPGNPAPPAGQSSSALTTAPTSRWELYQGVVLPYSAEHGPKNVQGLGVASGYTHDPAGALLAAVQLSTRTAVAPDETWQSIITTQVMPGEGRDAAVAAAQGTHVSPNSVPSSSLNQVAGFRVVNYTDTVAVLGIVYRTKTGTLQEGQTTVVWSDGDWKLVLQPNGSSSTAPTALPSLSGYTIWSGV